MFKKLLPVVMVLVAFTANAQGVKFDNGNNQNYWISNAGQYDLHLTFTNKTGKAAEVVYNKISVDYPFKWVVQFCDDVNCHSDFNSRDTFGSIANNAEGDLHITIYPMGFADTAVIKYEIYPLGNTSQRDTATVNVFVPWGAGRPSLQTGFIEVFPNPVSDMITFRTNTSGTLNVMDMNGKKITVSNAVIGENKINLSELSAGVYFLQINTPDGVLRKKFVKN